MIQHFQGKEGLPVLMEALRGQFLIDGNNDIANAIRSEMQLKEFSPGTAIFNQGDRGGDVYLVLAGRVSIRLDQQEVAVVQAGMHVGEIGMLEPFKGRSATVVALEPVVAVHITHQRFLGIAKVHTDLWRRLALELAHRLVKGQQKG